MGTAIRSVSAISKTSGLPRCLIYLGETKSKPVHRFAKHLCSVHCGHQNLPVASHLQSPSHSHTVCQDEAKHRLGGTVPHIPPATQWHEHCFMQCKITCSSSVSYSLLLTTPRPPPPALSIYLISSISQPNCSPFPYPVVLFCHHSSFSSNLYPSFQSHPRICTLLFSAYRLPASIATYTLPSPSWLLSAIQPLLTCIQLSHASSCLLHHPTPLSSLPSPLAV